MNRLIKIAVTALVLAGANVAFAEFATLNPDKSSVSFVTTKVQDIQEVMRFDQLSGRISDDGSVVIRIHANSINTMIPIRDDRMKEHLFEIADFPVITVSAEIDTDSLVGTSKRKLAATLDL
ncbi:MAG: YceI family protein, partial [Pseudomonadales bacterium]